MRALSEGLVLNDFHHIYCRLSAIERTILSINWLKVLHKNREAYRLATLNTLQLKTQNREIISSIWSFKQSLSSGSPLISVYKTNFAGTTFSIRTT